MIRATLSPFRAFLASEAAGGALLIAASVAAMLLVNAVPGGAEGYHHALEARLGPLSAHHWINDGLMAIFFLVVGLEIKREWTRGRLSDWEQRRLPFVAAAAGMAVPAILYLLVAGRDPALTRGWAIPAATDIAFAMGVLALLGRRVPPALTLLLATVAVVDDMGAIAIIALAYTASLNLLALGAAALILIGMVVLNRLGVRSALPYLLGFAALWGAVLLSGVHATLAGVLAAMTVPETLVRRLEHLLHPWSAYLVVPIFGFANAGVLLPADMGHALLAPLPLGIAAGLFLGKQIGIFSAIRLAAATGFAKPPRGATALQLYAMAMLCGIGFTMSLFIGGLAFPAHPDLVETAKMGVLTGSLLSALAGLTLLRIAPLHPEHGMDEDDDA